VSDGDLVRVIEARFDEVTGFAIAYAPGC